MSQTGLSAIIDIGSNSVRLVVYNGPPRAPAVLFNEKVLAGLGIGLNESGKLARGAMARALAALQRYRALVSAMDVTRLRVVATAAVRDAANGQEFVARVEALGLHVEILSGDAEACAAGYGVISAIPDADGVVGDLGGGSLELIRVHSQSVHARVSLPLGVLRLRHIAASGSAALERHIDAAMRTRPWREDAQGRPFYLVGGSWRTLARVHMRLQDHSFRVLHQYEMSADACTAIVDMLNKMTPSEAKALVDVSGARFATLRDAAAILDHVTKRLGVTRLIVSAHGLREGLLYQDMDAATRALDPLIAATREEGERQGRFAEHGDLLNAWIAPLFDDEPARLARLRHAACLLSDVAWRASPDFRAERGVDSALHGNWVAIDSAGRAIIAQALFTAFGGGAGAPPEIGTIIDEAVRLRAVRWGLAMRLGQRLSGGLAAPLQRSALVLRSDRLCLQLRASDNALVTDVVERRHKALASAFSLPPVLDLV